MIRRVRGVPVAVQDATFERIVRIGVVIGGLGVVMVRLGLVMVRREVYRSAGDGAPGRKHSAQDGGGGEAA